MEINIGNIGHLFAIIAFVLSIVSGVGFLFSQRATAKNEALAWHGFAKNAFLIQSLGVLGVVVSLYAIIAGGQYQYHYAWAHSSKNLPFYFVISSFWEGQEGSFLVWACWNVLLGCVVIFGRTKIPSLALAFFMLIQAFLMSMVLGVHIPWASMKMGSSPFMLLKDALPSPIYSTNPDFIPADGTGLNPLLQNIWMVIHPPIIFLGFALASIPFCIALSSLQLKQYDSFSKTTLPWMVLTVLILGMGIVMGAYWAYETLNFGGYWSWDPVENAVYIPWLVGLVALHLILIARNRTDFLRYAYIGVICCFLLVLYSTFLTRSGILGNSSVHAFTDLGLSGQLLLYLLFFAVNSLVILGIRWKDIPSASKNYIWLDVEFWFVLGTVIVGLAAFQVLLPTSIPVISKVATAIGFQSNLAPPSDPLNFYTSFQRWFAFGVLVSLGIAQLLFGQRLLNWKTFESNISAPLVAALCFAALVIIESRYKEAHNIALITAAFFAIMTSGKVLFYRRGAKLILWGGNLSHIGFAIMIIGMVYSSAKNSVISHNDSLQFAGNLPDEIKNENVLLTRGEPSLLKGYLAHYLGRSFKTDKGFVSKDDLIPTSHDDVFLAKKATGDYHKGDTVWTNANNTYFKIQLTDKKGVEYVIYPRMQKNEKMGMVASPDVVKCLTKDIYAHISNYVDEDKVTWSDSKKLKVKPDEHFKIGKHSFMLEGYAEEPNPVGFHISSSDIALTASITCKSLVGHDTIKPMLAHVAGKTRAYPVEVGALGLRFWITNIDPVTKEASLYYAQRQKDWVALKAISFPWIDLVWLGASIIFFGASISCVRRFKEIESDSSVKNPKPETIERKSKGYAPLLST